jgi:hypothetical protein
VKFEFSEEVSAWTDNANEKDYAGNNGYVDSILDSEEYCDEDGRDPYDEFQGETRQKE